MKILDILTSPWAIQPEKLQEIRGIYESHLRGDKIDFKAMEARIGLRSSLFDEEPLYENVGGVAVISVKGVLSKMMSFWSFFFGGASTKRIGQAFQAAINDPATRSILLDIDSPGGAVDGTEELAESIFNARGKKSVIAYTDGAMCSGAYWIGAAADKVYISGDTVMTGSIGVVAMHVDQSQMAEKMGIKVTEITGGKYKRKPSNFRALSESDEAYMQGLVDYLYGAFVDAVSRYRGADTETVLSKMADGKIFIGKQAVEAGLVDGVSTYEALLANMAGGAPAKSKPYKAGKEESIKMTLEELKQNHPEAYAQAFAEGKAAGVTEGETAGRTAGTAEGAAQERQRIADVRGQLIPGHEALVESMVADGKTTGPEAAVKVLAAEKVTRETRAAAFAEDGKPTVAAASGKDFEATTGKETAKNQAEAGDKLDKFAKEIKATEKCSYSDAMAKAKAAHPALATIYDGKEE